MIILFINFTSTNYIFLRINTSILIQVIYLTVCQDDVFSIIDPTILIGDPICNEYVWNYIQKSFHEWHNKRVQILKGFLLKGNNFFKK